MVWRGRGLGRVRLQTSKGNVLCRESMEGEVTCSAYRNNSITVAIDYFPPFFMSHLFDQNLVHGKNAVTTNSFTTD